MLYNTYKIHIKLITIFIKFVLLDMYLSCVDPYLMRMFLNEYLSHTILHFTQWYLDFVHAYIEIRYVMSVRGI